MSDKFDDYITNKVQHFEGGIAAPVWSVVKVLADAQQRKGIPGGICEIGVHHGKFLIGLMLAKGCTSNCLAIDVFDLQEYNLDRSGHGNLEIFRNNIKEYFGSEDAAGTLKGDSLSLNVGDIAAIQNKYGRFSMFSVDGCHTAEHTYHDLALAVELTSHGGLIFVDDYNHQNFPGVHEGVCRYFFTGIPKVAPICFVGGKLVLTDVSHYAFYSKHLRAHLGASLTADLRVVEAKRFGWQALTVGFDKRAILQRRRMQKSA